MTLVRSWTPQPICTYETPAEPIGHKIDTVLFPEVTDVGGISVYWNSHISGGGEHFGSSTVQVLRELFPDRRWSACFEWCAGPAFIGFQLLAEGLCHRLFASDVYAPAIKAIEKTVEANNETCQGRVWTQHSHSVSTLPLSWKFDLVVGNPPHWNPALGQFMTQVDFATRITADLGWKAHQDFFQNIGRHLTADSVILLKEHSLGSGPAMFEPWLEPNGLYLHACHQEQVVPMLYYLEIRPKNV